MACNETGGGVLRSLSLGGSPASWRGNTAGCAKSGAKLCAINFFRSAEVCAKFTQKIGPMTKKCTQVSRLLSPSNFPPVFEPFSWLVSPAHPGMSCHGLFPFFMNGAKPHRESGPGVQQSYNITSNEIKRNVLERKMPQGLLPGLVLVK